MSRLLLSVILLLPAMASAEDSKIEETLHRMFETHGVSIPVSITVADRQVKGVPDLLVTRAELSGVSVVLSVRCRFRTQCGDVIAIARFADRERAADAYGRLVPSSRKYEKVTPLIHAGEKVKLIIQTQTLRLELPAMALDSGAMAQSIQVRDPKTRKIYRGVVVSPKEVRAAL